MIRIIITLLALLALTSASCPNDCSHHGKCNIYSACDCYRNWMGADCSERVCPFGHSFVDTPQGDLNSDGRVDRSDIRTLRLETTIAWTSTYDTDPPVFAANVFMVETGEPGVGDVPSFATSNCYTISESVGYELTDGGSNSGNVAFDLQVVISENEPSSALEQSGVYFMACADVEAVHAGSLYSVMCYEHITPSGDFSAAVLQWTAIQPVSTTYSTQFTNTKTWELFPSDHGIGITDNTLLSYWDEGHFYSECSGKGQCDRATGECQCYPGYMGAGCSRTNCPSDCSGHGVCSRLEDVDTGYNYWDSVKTQQCVCDPGYTGIDCAQRVCPKGDDPITKPVSYTASGSSLSSTLYHIAPQRYGQVPEIQYFGHVSKLLDTFTNVFALEFTDEFGDKWTTMTLDFATATAADVEEALESLPNSVVENVEVSYSFCHESVCVGGGPQTGGVPAADWATCAGQASSDAAPSGNCEYMPRSWAITFISNSGDVAPLGVRYSVEDDTTTQTGGSLMSRETHDSNGGANELVMCTDPTTNSEPFCSFDSDITDTDALERSAASFGWAQVGSTDGDGNAIYEPVSGGDDESQWMILTNNGIVFTATGREGTQENVICSNRGLCDYDTGLCQCFNGFTDDDCSRQNALAMY
eukprot:g2959.t1